MMSLGQQGIMATQVISVRTTVVVVHLLAVLIVSQLTTGVILPIAKYILHASWRMEQA